jgi:hypothetical protein
MNLYYPTKYYKDFIPAGLVNLLIFFTSAVLPVIIYVFAIGRGIWNKKIIQVVFLIGIMFFSFEIFLAWSGKFVLVSRYALHLAPYLYLLQVIGLTSIKNKLISVCLVASLIIY